MTTGIMTINNIGRKYRIESLRVYSLILIYTKYRTRETNGLKKSEMTFEILCNNEDCFSSIIKFKNQIYHYNLKNQAAAELQNKFEIIVY